MIPLLLAALLLVMTQISRDIYWYDEEQSLFIVGGGEYAPVTPGEFLARVADNARPPLYPALFLLNGTLLGWTEFASRILSTFAGLLSVAVMYRLGTDLKSPRLGFIAATLLSFSAFYLHYWHDVRDYTLYVLLTTLSGWLYWRFMTRRWRATRTEKTAFVLALTGLFYIHYVAPITYAALGAYHLFFAKRNARWNGILFLFFVPLLLFAFWLPVTLIAASLQSSVSRSLPLIDILQWSAFGYGNGLGVLVLALFGLAAIRLRGRQMGFVTVWLVVALVAALVLNAFGDFLFHVRHMIGIIVPFMLLIALLIDDLLQWRAAIGILMITGWVIVGVFFAMDEDFMLALPGQERDLPYTPMHASFDLIDQCATSNDAAIYYIADKPADERVNDRVIYYYLQNRLDRFGQVQSAWDLSDITSTPNLEIPYTERLATLTADAPHIWYFQLDGLPPRLDEPSAALISNGYALCSTFSAEGLQGTLFGLNCSAEVQDCISTEQ